MKMLHVFTEEPSAKNVFDSLLPRIVPQDVFFRVYPHQGKQDLEHALRTTLPSISKIPDSVILITRDQDSADCKILKNELNNIVKDSCNAPYLIRIVCRELESWFLGDLEAVKKAYPRFNPHNYQFRADLRNVDTIQNPNEVLRSIIPEYKTYTSLPKLETSLSISQYLDLSHNKSTSFNHTISAISRLVGSPSYPGVQLGLEF